MHLSRHKRHYNLQQEVTKSIQLYIYIYIYIYILYISRNAPTSAKLHIFIISMLVMGLYLKSHHKKTEDEVLDHFGADGEEDSEDDELLLDAEKRRASAEAKRSEIFGASEAQHSTTPISGALGILVGSNKSAVSKQNIENIIDKHSTFISITIYIV